MAVTLHAPSRMERASHGRGSSLTFGNMKRLITILIFSLCLAAPAQEIINDEYLEINVDIDGDGIPDRLVSEPIYNFGRAGGHWDVFLGKKGGGFTSVGIIFAHPWALRIERLFDSIRLWIYWRNSGTSGTLGFYTLKEGHIDDSPKMIDISPGDGGTDLGRSLYGTVFPANLRLTALKKTPNKALEPTTIAVTPPAAQESRQP